MKKLLVTAILLVFASTANAQEKRACTPDAANLLKDLEACKPQPPKKAKVKKADKKKTVKPAPKPAPPAPTPATQCDCPTCCPGNTVNNTTIIVMPPAPQPEPKAMPVIDNPVLPKKPTPDSGDYRKLRIGVGVMGFGYALKDLDVYAAWGWGPMLQLQLFPTQNLEVTLALGIGLGLEKVTSSPGHMRGWMAEAGGTYWLTKHFGLALSARGDLIDTKGETVYVVGGQPGVAFQGYLGPTRWVFRLNGFGGVASDNGSQHGNGPTGGVTANTSVSF